MSQTTQILETENKRFYAMDALRATAMLLGVFFHALLFGGMFGGGGPPGFPGGPGGFSGSMTAQDWLHSFRMPLFFLISGFFCAMMFGKYGLGVYLYRRWLRIGLALIIGIFTFVPLYQVASESFRGGPPMGGGPGGPGGPAGPGGFSFDPPQPPPGFVPPPLIRFDTNEDGTIDDGEWEIAKKAIMAGEVDPPGTPGMGGMGLGGQGQQPPRGEGKGLRTKGGQNQGKQFKGGQFPGGQFKDGKGKGGFPGRGQTKGEHGPGNINPEGANFPENFPLGGPGGGGPGGPPRGPGGPRGGMFGPPGEASSWLFGSNVKYFTLSHLWFLWYLLVFATVAPFVGILFQRLIDIFKPMETLAQSAVRFQLLPVLLGLVGIPLLQMASGFFGWSLGFASGIGKGFPDFLWNLEPDMPFYFAFFLAGWWMFHSRAQLPAIANWWGLNLGLGIASHCGAIWISRNYSMQRDLEYYQILKICGFALYSFGSAWTAWGFVGVFQKFFDRPSTLGKYMADTAFWVYLLHQALLIPILSWLGPFKIPWYANGTLATLITMFAASLLFEAMVRHTYLMTLFGPGTFNRAKSNQSGEPLAPADLSPNTNHGQPV